MNFSSAISASLTYLDYFFGKFSSGYSSLTDIAAPGISTNKKNHISNYIKSLVSQKVIKKFDNEYQTDSIIYLPVFGSADLNSKSFISPSKLWDSKLERSSVTRGGLYDFSQILSSTDLFHRKGEVVFPNINLEYSGTISLNPNKPNSESILDQAGYFCGFYSPEKASGTYLSIKKGGHNILTIAPSDTSDADAFNTSDIKVTSDLIPASVNLTFEDQGPGMYLANIRKKAGLVRKGNDVNTQLGGGSRVNGFLLEIEVYHLSPALDSVPTVLYSSNIELDPVHGYELSYLFKNIAPLKELKTKIFSLTSKLSKTDLRVSVERIIGNLAAFKLKRGYIGRKSTTINNLTKEDVTNYYNGDSRISLNKDIAVKFKSVYSATPLLGGKLAKLDTENDKTLALLKLTEDVYESDIKNTVDINYGSNYGQLNNQITKSGTFVYPGLGIDSSYTFEMFNYGGLLPINSYSMIGAGTGLNTLEAAYNFMQETKKIVKVFKA